MRNRAPLPVRAALVAAASILAGCGGADVVVYVSLDRVFSEELVKDFEAQTGLSVDARYDIEQSKTVGHVRVLIEEKDAPRCDVFWNNEIAQTIRLAELGLLAPYESPEAADIPDRFKDSAGRWTGFAARARVLIVNRDLADPEELGGTELLLDPEWAGKCGIARPLTGTTLTHATALYQVMGEEWARAFFEKVAAANRAGTLPQPASNGQAMTMVESGELAWAFTDTDDYNVAHLRSVHVARVYPDQEPGEGVLTRDGEPIGTLLVPNTIMLIEGGPNPENGKRFVDWVLRREIEERLAEARSAQIPVRDDVPRPDHVGRIGDFRVMDVDYEALGRDIAARTDELNELFTR